MDFKDFYVDAEVMKSSVFSLNGPGLENMIMVTQSTLIENL